MIGGIIGQAILNHNGASALELGHQAAASAVGAAVLSAGLMGLSCFLAVCAHCCNAVAERSGETARTFAH